MLPLTEEMKALGQLQMVSAALNGTISLTEAKVENGYMVLTTDQLGIYGIVGIPAAPSPTATPSVSPKPTAEPTASPTTVPTTVPTTKPTEKPNSPQTGDSSNNALYIVLCVLSVSGLAALLLKKRRAK